MPPYLIQKKVGFTIPQQDIPYSGTRYVTHLCKDDNFEQILLAYPWWLLSIETQKYGLENRYTCLLTANRSQTYAAGNNFILPVVPELEAQGVERERLEFNLNPSI